MAGWGHVSSSRAAAPASPGVAGEPRPPAPGQAGRGRPKAAPRARGKLNTGGLLYGTVVSAAALSVGADRGDSAADLIDAMIATLIIYWLAHVYTATVSGRDPEHPERLGRRVITAARREATILAGGLPAVVVVVTEQLAGVTLWVTVLSGLGVAVVMLAVDGLLAARYAGVKGWRLAGEIAAAALFGVLIAALLVSVHDN